MFQLTTSSPTRIPALHDGLDHYLSEINRFPLLDLAEEQDLARKWYEHNDTQAAHCLVVGNLRFVVHIAKGYLGYGLPFADLIQEGNLGLMQAVKRFNPNVGVRLISFAVHWIKAEIHNFILRHWRIVRIATTKVQRKLFFNLRKNKQGLNLLTSDEARNIANQLNVPVKEVYEMEKRLSGSDVSFDPLAENQDEHETRVPSHYLADPAQDLANQIEDRDWRLHQNNQLEKAMRALDPRSRAIIEKRWFPDDGAKATLQELAKTYGISAERIRQLEANAIRNMRRLVAE